MEYIAKTNLSQKRSFMDFGLYVCCFLIALGIVFLVSAALETRLKIDGYLVMYRISSQAGGGGGK